MRIINVQISNYKSCNKTSIEINTNLTALIGINGSGKTNILSAIRLLKRASNERFSSRQNSSEGLFETNMQVTFLDNDIKIVLKATYDYNIGNRPEEQIEFVNTRWKISKLLPKKWVEIPIEILNVKDFNMFESLMRRGKFLRSNSFSKFLSIKEQIPKQFLECLFKVASYLNTISYYSATQFSNPLKAPTSVELEERERQITYRNYPRYDTHTSFILDLIRLKKEENKKYSRYINLIGPNGIGLVDAIEYEEIEFSTEEVNVKSGGQVIKEKRKKIIIVPKIHLNNKVLSFNQLSEGTLKTIALLFYLIENENSLILLEEPEVCVHHGLLKSVIEVIKSESKYKQIIISTHSDYVLDQLEPENLIVVSKDNDGTHATTLSKTLTKENYKALHEYLESSGNLGDYWKESGFEN